MAHPKCINCDKPAVWHMGPKDQGVLLCLDHAKIAQEIQSQQNEIYERTINMLEAQMWDTVGLPRQAPPFPERKPPVYIRDERTQNMIKIENSGIIGAVNTGTIQSLNVSLTNINQSNKELASAIKSFTEAVIKEPGLTDEQKKEIIEQISVLGQEIEQPKEKQRKGLLKTLMGGIKNSIQTAVTLDSLWSISERLIRVYLGL